MPHPNEQVPENENLTEEISKGLRSFSTNQSVIGCATILATVATIIGFFISGLQVGFNTNPLPQVLPLEQTVHAAQTVTSAVGTAIALGIIPSPPPLYNNSALTATAIIQQATQISLLTPNIPQTATAFIVQAATENFMARSRAEGVTDSQFTATALINQQATQNIVGTSRALGVSDGALTATAIIQQATAIANSDMSYLNRQSNLNMLGEGTIDFVAAGTVHAKINEQIVTAAFANQTQSFFTGSAKTQQFETDVANLVETQIFQLTASIPTSTFIPLPTHTPDAIALTITSIVQAATQGATFFPNHTSDDSALTATSIIQAATQRALLSETQVQTEQPFQSVWLPLFAIATAAASLLGIFTLIVRNRRG